MPMLPKNFAYWRIIKDSKKADKRAKIIVTVGVTNSKIGVVVVINNVNKSSCIKKH